ncbi:glycoside hydrolase family 2 protein [Dactylosporangium sp. McL0621]|uniref:glycoside hydrolase family 2 protein n=1 Tax=Dactylosporangium sp. McL0621 TaxID=3415678 RepID=UPI003CE74F82
MLESVPRPEYPRPHFDRSAAWLPLNGAWDFSRNGETFAETIMVPFPWEHPASGIEAHWLGTAWYRRRIQRPPDWAGQRTILHFGAVHHTATISIGGTVVTTHTGGYLPFEADITAFLDSDGAAEVVVRVDAPADKRFIPHGKQRSLPRDDYDGCAFTPSSGIWQSVWLEPRPAAFVESLQLRPSVNLDAIEAVATIAGEGTVVFTVDGVSVEGPVATLPIPDPRLWSPEDPHLYAVTAVLTSAAGVDTVTGYTGLRRVEWHDAGLRLNGRPIFLRGVLDQGFWPEGGHAAPTDEALRRDLELARAAGFNLVRKHLKLEDPRWLHWADRLGILVWAEPPSTGRFTPEAVAPFEDVLGGMVARDGNHPSIIIWGAYNEEWGLDWDVPGDPAKQDAVRRAYRLLRSLDVSRPVMDNSGWAHVESDLVDWHYYDDDAASWARVTDRLTNTADDGFPVKLGPDLTVRKEIAAPGFDVTGKPFLNGEYGGGWTSVERGWHQRWQTQELRRHARTAGYIYTELYDIEHETVGVYTYDRRTKDLGGTVPSDVHAETTLIVDVTPQSPGCDVAVAPGAALTLPVRISHHGSVAVSGTLHWSLRSGGGTSGASVEAKPFLVTEPVAVTVTPSAAVDRLDLWLTDASGATLARAFVDLAS